MADEKELVKTAEAMGRGVSAELFEHEMTTNSRILGRETGLNVVIGGEKAATDGKTVVLPALDHSKTVSGEAANVARGFVNHEAAHLRYSNGHTIRRFSKHQKHAGFLNAMEDVRIEKQFSETYGGAQRHFEAAANATLKRFVNQVASGDVKVDDKNRLAPMATAWAGRRKLGFDVDPVAMAKLEDLAGKDVMKMAETLADAAIAADGTMSIGNYIEEWLGKIEPAKKEEEEEHKRRMAGGTGYSAGEGEGDEEGAGGSGDGDGDPEEGKEGQASLGEDKPQPFTGMSARGFFDPSMADALSEMLPKGSTGYQYRSPIQYDRVWDDFEGYVKKITEQHPHDLATSKQRVAKGENLYYAFQYNDHNLDNLRQFGLFLAQHWNENLGPAVRAMKMALERGLVVAKQRDWNPGQLQGNIDPKRLATVMTGSRDFYRKRAPMDMVDTAVTLLIDMSGSMNGEKAIEAAKSAYVFAEALTKVGVPIEVLGFSSDAKMVPHRERYDRNGVIDMPVYKSFLEPYRASMWKVALVANMTHTRMGGNNPDGDSLVLAWRRLRVRPEPRKVLIVFSDGHPAAGGTGNESHHLKRVVGRIILEGGTPFGIGIMDESVKHFYPEYIVVNDAAELPVKAGSFMRQLLIPDARKKRAARAGMRAA